MTKYVNDTTHKIVKHVGELNLRQIDKHVQVDLDLAGYIHKMWMYKMYTSFNKFCNQVIDSAVTHHLLALTSNITNLENGVNIL